MLVCSLWYAPARAFGGTVTVAVATVKGALAAGHEVTVVTTDVLDLHSRAPADTPAEPAGARGTAYPVGGELTIGRGGGCGIALPADTFVSTVHARAYAVDDDLWIEDLGSTNGTLVNDERLQQPARLQRGDRVTVGSTVLEATR